MISQLQSRNGDGVNFDFESVPAAQKANMVSFCRRAVRGIKAVLPAAEISLATPAVNWSDGWDLGTLAGICDYIIMMGYNYYWSGSTTAGPVAPVSGETYHIVRSINEDYLADGVPPEQTPPRGTLVRIRLARYRQRKKGCHHREPAHHGNTLKHLPWPLHHTRIFDDVDRRAMDKL
ncbi:MAG: glycosyl hydrolase family 18 protein [Marinilabiliales bacterium]|nr:glycosyl hydrolase family 18 protein [Marinilabiliales bacterium]